MVGLAATPSSPFSVENRAIRFESGNYTGTLTIIEGETLLPLGGVLFGQVLVYGGVFELPTAPLTLASVTQTNGVVHLKGGSLVISSGWT